MKITAVVPFVVDPGYGKNFLITEHFVNFEPRGREVAVSPFRVEAGYITLPTAPGLGIELREDVLARYAYREHALRPMPAPGDEGP
jgi:L-alanine-DL-glutamate epimerase-like enolase superfamily enzyme